MKKKILARWQLYLLLLLPLLYIIIFAYVPMGGLIIAFKQYDFRKGILGSPWVGLKHFKDFFKSYKFVMVLKNTLTLSLYSLAISFPLPIVFALLLNSMRSQKYAKVIQTVTYIPHFFSTVIMVGLLTQILSNRTGIYGTLYTMLTGQNGPNILASGPAFKHIYVWSGVWRIWDTAQLFISLLYLAWIPPFMRLQRSMEPAASREYGTLTSHPSYRQRPSC